MSVEQLSSFNSSVAANAATSGLFDLSLRQADYLDVAKLLDHLHDRNLIPLTRSESLPFRSLAIVFNGLIRRLQVAENLVQRAAWVAELARFRSAVLARYANLAPQNSPVRDYPPAPEEPSFDLGTAVALAYRMLLGREAAEAEINIWKKNISAGLSFHEFLLRMEQGEEAQRRKRARPLDDLRDGEFIQVAYETLLGRAAHPTDIEVWASRLRAGSSTRQQVLELLIEAGRREKAALQAGNDERACHLMGTDKKISVDDWNHRARSSDFGAEEQTSYNGRLHIKTEPKVLVSAITSLYKGGDFIEKFMENITSQSIFDDYCELLIIDADSPDNEAETIRRYTQKHKNIKYLRMNYRIGIYDAWNVGVKEARGEYLTNANLDDLRRFDSFELQAGVLDELDFVDVVYQDFYYSFDPELDFSDVARFGYASNLPVITPYNMLMFNSPHNAPMWRAKLHRELGYFDTHFKSAGDYEFWLRCLVAGKLFYKLNDPHVVYYQNPNGISTRPDTRGAAEAREIQARYAKRLVSPHMLADIEEFRSTICGRAARAGGRDTDDRYTLVQREMRQVARTMKYSRRDGDL